MTDSEIHEFLKKNNYKIKAQDGVAKIINRSYQIMNAIYDEGTKTMTIVTPDNTFTFEWILGDGK